MSEETICLQCGSIGYENAFVYCIRCLSFAVHRYCLDVVPQTFDEFVHWHCDDCKVSENAKVFSRNKTKNDDVMLVEASTACAKSESLECGGLATQHISVELDVINDENATVLPVDVIKISQQSSSLHQLGEDKVQGDLIGSKEKNKKFMSKKKRKRNVTKSTIDEDQHRVAKAQSEERLKADINDCTRLASDLTLPSEVKENGSSEKKDEEKKKRKKVKNMKNRIRRRNKRRGIAESTAQKEELHRHATASFDGWIREEIDSTLASKVKENGSEKNDEAKIKNMNKRRGIAESTAQKEELYRHATASFDEWVKVDITKCTRSEIDSTLASKVKENGSEKNDEAKKIKNMIKRRGKRKRNNKRNIVESNVQEDKHSLATTSYLEGVPGDLSQCTRSTIDSTIPYKLIENGCSKKRDIKNKNFIIESSSGKDQHRIATASYDERVKEDINECTLSKVKGNECSEKKDETCISKPLDSITDLGTTDVPAVNSSDEPSKLSKQKKTIITSSETISQEQVLKIGVAQPLLLTEEKNLVSNPALSTEGKDLVLSQYTQNRGPGDNEEEQASTSCRSTNSCKYYPNELGFSVAEPIAMPIWRGSLNILSQKYEDIDELIAHISNRACYKVYEAASQFQPVLRAEMLPKTDIWPNSFKKAEPNGDNIALYFFPSKISKQVFEQLVDEMIREELAFRALVQNAELLIFTSTELPLRYWRFHNKYYLWGVFRQRKQANPLPILEVAEIPSMINGGDDRTPISPVSNSAKSVENNENLT